MSIEAALLTAIAKAVAGRLGADTAESARDWLRQLLGRAPAQKALREATRDALTAFEESHPDWVASMLDEHFLTHGAASAMARAVEPNVFPAAVELADSWNAQFGTGQDHAQRDPQLMAACEAFLHDFRREMRRRDVFRPVFDSYVLDQTLDEVRQLKAAVDVAGMRRAGEGDFAEPIVSAYADLGRVVESLTDEQCRVMDVLRRPRRALVSGTAGSGKTLVAAQKAIVLSRAGRETLFVCHNPLLAEWVRTLTAGSNVVVKAFEALVGELVSPGVPSVGAPEWTSYSSPTLHDLWQALEPALEGARQFDAVIVDEGQDFTDEWRTLIEATLRSADSEFYIFYDDRQSLLPYRAAYPIAEPLVDLSRNCRNGGAIFEFMRALNDDAPQPDKALAGLGQALCVAASGDLRPTIQACCNWLDKVKGLERCVALLGGDRPFSESVLADLELMPESVLDWPGAVRDGLYQIFGLRRHEAAIPAPRWSEVEPLLQGLGDHGNAPTYDDIAMVARVAREARLSLPQPRLGAGWEVVDLGNGPLLRIRPKGGAHEIVRFFSTGQWAEDLLPLLPRAVRFAPHLVAAVGDVPVYTIGEYKGLEHDAVLLVMQGGAPELPNELFVGVSRARATLAVALDPVSKRALTPRQRQKLGVQ